MFGIVMILLSSTKRLQTLILPYGINYDQFYMIQEETIRLFIRFLKDEKCYKRYVHNLLNTHSKNGAFFLCDAIHYDRILKRDINYTRNIVHYIYRTITLRNMNINEDIINSSFSWRETPEGHHFWKNLRSKFLTEFLLMKAEKQLKTNFIRNIITKIRLTWQNRKK